MNTSKRKRVLFLILSLGMFIAGAMMPAAALAQMETNGQANNGQAPAFNIAVQGETAGTVGGTLLNAIDWFGNIICPILGAGALAHTIIQARSGGRWAPSLATSGGLFAISAITRLAESFVIQGNSGITSGF